MRAIENSIHNPPLKVLMTPELMEEWASRDLDGNRMIWDWGEPDADGFYTPTITIDYDDNIVNIVNES